MKQRKTKWHLISNRSSQQQITTQIEKSPPIPDGETLQQHLNHNRVTTSTALISTSPDSQCIPITNQMSILLSLTLFGLIFQFVPPKLDGFNDEIIDLNSEFKLEKIVLNTDCCVSSSPTNSPMDITYTPSFNFCPTGVVLAEFNNAGCEFNVVSAARAAATIVTKENKNQNIFESGPVWRHNTQTKNTNHIQMHQEVAEMMELVQLVLAFVSLIILDVYLMVVWMELDYNMICHLVCVLFFRCFFSPYVTRLRIDVLWVKLDYYNIICFFWFLSFCCVSVQCMVGQLFDVTLKVIFPDPLILACLIVIVTFHYSFVCVCDSAQKTLRVAILRIFLFFVCVFNRLYYRYRCCI